MNRKHLRIVIITQGVSDIVIPLMNSQHEVVGLLESNGRSVHRSTLFKNLLRKSFRTIKSIFRTRVTMQSFALSNGVPFESMKTGEEEKVENWVRGCNPDLLVVYSMSSLLPAIIFSIPPLGAINMHPSWLPDYRGPNPYFWQCFDQLEEFGLTIHQVTAGEDAGSILAQVRVPMVFGLKKEERMKMLIEQKGVPLLLKTLEDIAANEVAVSEQPKKSPTRRAKRITADEARELVNWETWPTLRIWNLLRATEGDLAILPSPFRYVPGFRWSMGECVSTIKQSKPGEIVHNRGRFYLQCRDGSIQLKIKFSFKNII